MAKLIFGCGYLGSRVAQRWRERGDEVYVVTRSGERAAALKRAGYQPIVADVMRPASLIGLPVAETVLYAVGFDRTAGVSIRQVFVEGLRNVLASLPAETGRLIYVSSTGVYGQCSGEWIDEHSICQPQREGGQACHDAEQLLIAHPLGQRAIRLRMAGLYGPGRIPNAEEIRRGQPVAVPSAGFLNLIHVDDAVAAVLAAEKAKAPALYLVADGHPVERSEYYRVLARILGAPAPRFESPPAGSPHAARAGASKRIRNERMLTELGVAPSYPSYREGLAAIVSQ